MQGEVRSVLPKHYSKTLENGLEIVVIPLDNKSGVVETNIFYKVGSRNEIMGKSGIAHMLEHLNFKSTKNLKSGEFDEIVKKFGGVTNASTGFDYTRYFVRSSSGNMDKSLELFADLLGNLTLKEEEFLPERDVVAEERRWRTDNSPMGYLYFRFFNSAYIYHPYHWTPIGFMDDIKNWSIKDIQDFHSAYYRPSNAVIVVAGDVEPQSVFDSASKHFSSIPNPASDIPAIHTMEPDQDGQRRTEIKKDTEVEYIAIGYKVPSFDSKDQVALNALSELMSSGKSSLLQVELVDKKRLASQIYSYSMDLKDNGVFLFIGVGNNGIKAEVIESGIKDIVSKIKNGEIKQEDLDKVKINSRASFIYGLEDASSVASLFGSYFARGNIEPLLRYEQDFENLSIKNLVDVANKYFVDENSTVVILRK